jgi:hypothetical protein
MLGIDNSTSVTKKKLSLGLPLIAVTINTYVSKFSVNGKPLTETRLLATTQNVGLYERGLI